MNVNGDEVMEHFKNPKNMGEIADADGVGKAGNPTCGDVITFYVKVDGRGRLKDVKFKTHGCGIAMAISSMISELAKSKTAGEAMRICRDDIVQESRGLPRNDMHCSNLGFLALRRAIEDCLQKSKKGVW